jgi:hypothetical protein
MDPVCPTHLSSCHPVPTRRKPGQHGVLGDMLSGIIQSRTSCQINFLFKSKLAHKVTSFGVGILPRWVGDLTRPWRGILRWVGLVGDAASCDDGVLVDILRVCGVRELRRHVSI